VIVMARIKLKIYPQGRTELHGEAEDGISHPLSLSPAVKG
jgi:hypothetical protein